MDGESRATVSSWRRVRLILRSVLAAAAAVVALWLFVIYRAPARREHPEREEVVLWHMWTGDDARIVRDIVKHFNDSQDRYEVRPLSVARGTLKTLIASAGGDPPDCMTQWDSVISAWADLGALTPLDELMSPREWQDLQKRLYPVVRKIGSYKGHFYGLSVGMNIWAMYYRTDHFEEAGLDPDPKAFPQSLEELDRIAEKLYRYDKNGRIERVGFLPSGLPHWVAVFGSSLYDSRNDRLTIDSPRNIEALEWMVSYYKNEKHDFEKVQNFQAALGSTMDAGWHLISGRYSITVDGQWRITEAAKYAPKLKYAAAPIPYPPGGKPLAGWSNGNFMIIPRDAKNKAGAWAFIRFWSGLDDPERAAEFYTWGGWLPIVPEVANAPIYQAFLDKYPQFRIFVKILASPNVQVTPPVPVQRYYERRLGNAEEAARRGDVTPATALREAARDIQRELERKRR